MTCRIPWFEEGTRALTARELKQLREMVVAPGDEGYYTVSLPNGTRYHVSCSLVEDVQYLVMCSCPQMQRNHRLCFHLFKVALVTSLPIYSTHF